MFPKLTTTVFSLLIAAAAVVALAVPESSESGASAAPAHPDSAGVTPRLGPNVPFGVSSSPVHDGSDEHEDSGAGDSCNCNCDRHDTVPLYRYTNPSGGADLLTVNPTDWEISANSLLPAGVAAYVFPKPTRGTTAFWRFYNTQGTEDNFYSIYTGVPEDLRDYQAIEIEFYIDVQPRCPGEVPLYRYWCPNLTPNKHIFTINWTPTGITGCQFEGVPGYVFPPPPSQDKGSDKGPSVS